MSKRQRFCAGVAFPALGPWPLTHSVFSYTLFRISTLPFTVVTPVAVNKPPPSSSTPPPAETLTVLATIELPVAKRPSFGREDKAKDSNF